MRPGTRRSWLRLCAAGIFLSAASVHMGIAADTLFYYETMPGRIMGVYPDYWTLERLLQLRVQYGFSHVFAEPDTMKYNNALRAGFAPSNIMMDIWDLHITVDNYPAGLYYKDEPVEHDCAGHTGAGHLFTPEELAEITAYVHANRPGSPFVISGYKRCSHNNIAVNYVDAFTYSAYQNWSNTGIPICHVNIGWGDDWESPWLPGSDDQRDSWTATRLAYGTKHYMTWINGATDDFPSLFGHANYLGFFGLWQYNPPGPIDPARLESYCYTAWQNGWMKRIPQVPVPVRLAQFTAKSVSGGNILLEWVTLSETNSYGFEVQRRSGVAETFATLPNSFIPGQGTTLVPRTYTFVDSNAGPGAWHYRLKQIDLDGSVEYGPEAFASILSGVAEESLHEGFFLEHNYPNPFNPATTITYTIPKTQHVRVKVYDLLGREVTTLVDRLEYPGTHRVTWDARGYSSGTYISRLTAGDWISTRRLVLLR